MGDSQELVCKKEKMEDWSSDLVKISTNMKRLAIDTENYWREFCDAYEGDAKEEVLVFFESLMQHLSRLSVFYIKMAQFIDMTSLSFIESDTKMTEQMGG